MNIVGLLHFADIGDDILQIAQGYTSHRRHVAKWPVMGANAILGGHDERLIRVM